MPGFFSRWFSPFPGIGKGSISFGLGVKVSVTPAQITGPVLLIATDQATTTVIAIDQVTTTLIATDIAYYQG